MERGEIRDCRASYLIEQEEYGTSRDLCCLLASKECICELELDLKAKDYSLE